MNNNYNVNPLSYISSGVACFALILLNSHGILNNLTKRKPLKNGDLEKINNNLMLNRAVLELEINNIILKHNKNYKLSKFGFELINYFGLIQYIYEGYTKLFANQEKENLTYQKYANDSAIIQGSDDLAYKFFNPILYKELQKINNSGTICDLGCGDGTRLNDLCNLTKCNGLGIEISNQAFNLIAKKFKKRIRYNKKKKTMHLSDNLIIEQGNIYNLNKVYSDVTLLMQTMVMHDISEEKQCIKILNSYLKNFPNLKFFVYCDIVAPSKKIKSQLPGFDYIHALLGIKTKTYKEMIQIFNKSNYTVLKSTPIDNLPNTFIWILQPNNL